MNDRSVWLVWAVVVVVALWVGYIGISVFGAAQGLGQALSGDRASVSCDAYLEPRIGGGLRR